MRVNIHSWKAQWFAHCWHTIYVPQHMIHERNHLRKSLTTHDARLIIRAQVELMQDMWASVCVFHAVVLLLRKVLYIYLPLIFKLLFFAWVNHHLPGGACRDSNDLVLKHDCTAHSVLFDPSTNTVRPLTILTDTWCSSGQFEADGTLLQTGGDYEGVRKVRYSFCIHHFQRNKLLCYLGHFTQHCTWGWPDCIFVLCWGR